MSGKAIVMGLDSRVAVKFVLRWLKSARKMRCTR